MKLDDILKLAGMNPNIVFSRYAFEDINLRASTDEDKPLYYIQDDGQIYKITKEDFEANDWYVIFTPIIQRNFNKNLFIRSN